MTLSCPLKWRCLQKPRSRRQLQSQSQQKQLWSKELKICFSKNERDNWDVDRNRNDGKVEMIFANFFALFIPILAYPKKGGFHQRRRVMPPWPTKVGTTGSGSAGHPHRPREGGCWRVEELGLLVVYVPTISYNILKLWVDTPLISDKIPLGWYTFYIYIVGIYWIYSMDKPSKKINPNFHFPIIFLLEEICRILSDFVRQASNSWMQRPLKPRDGRHPFEWPWKTVGFRMYHPGWCNKLQRIFGRSME